VANSPTVAVIDIGSNSIKVLVAARAPSGGVTALKSRTIDARISAGISTADPRLGKDGMARGLEAIRALLQEAAPFAPVRTILVATSAVRDARNGADFQEHVRAATGHDIKILTGDEEANLIGRGLTCDPALTALRDFCVFDLGGGSLECLAFEDRNIRQAVSLQLGCVRLTEKFLPDPTAPFTREAAHAMAEHTRAVVSGSGFTFIRAPAIGTGGTVSTVRSILAARGGTTFAQSEPVVAVADLRALLAEFGALPLSARRQVVGLPPQRADVFPAALTTLIALAELGGFDAYRNSLFNLRYGLAARALESLETS
jgi:exopolyphosphatase/guanosine-5'-triphosphate,3'-diphosphate pyrophosphatase